MWIDVLANQAESRTRPYLKLAEQSANPLGLGDPQQKNWPSACCAVPVQNACIKIRYPPAAGCNKPDNLSLSE